VHFKGTAITAARIFGMRDRINIIFPVQLPEAGKIATFTCYVFCIAFDFQRCRLAGTVMF
jgi:hypothetical protein